MSARIPSPTSPTPPFETVAVVGCGLMGGSVALAARVVPGVVRVLVADRDADVATAAVERGVADAAGRAEEVAGEADLVVLGVPVAAVPELADRIAPKLSAGAVVTDLGSVKARIVADVERSLARQPADRRAAYVGGHPMVGSEGEGLDAADGTMFQGATWVLTPTESSDPGAFNRLAAFLRAIGASVLAVDPATHDRVAGVVSHLPQVLASALMSYAAETAEGSAGVLAMAGGGFRDVTRVAGSSPSLWSGILEENRDAVLAALDGFVTALHGLRDALEHGDRDAVLAFLRSGREGRGLLPGKVTDAAPFDLVVPIEDRPGRLAEVTTALGAAGVNIEDLHMRHAEIGDRGALVVSVAGRENAERARTVLASRGVESHIESR
ncbi:MAG: prephenate dehydrogenase/arogenate dehydrogenase family protein [Nitriliruptorales bacterium]